ncbi:MAG: UDP-N-acetylenolpyruvoylglucosamine reductase, partial [Clostridiaceae bacterium]|nr:UDP-N-acetylenolpyruvoylglucosamine reductase [Clostridiaceae bacterium]
MEVLDFLRTIYNDEDIIQNADMKQLTTFKVGGCADFLVYP